MNSSLFRGRFEHAIDEKSRLSIPARFREVIENRDGGKLILTNLPQCLVAYSPEEWEVIEAKASRLSTLEADVQTFLRFFISGATECDLDKQGRILIPPTLKSAAAIERQVVLVGMLGKIEIWSRQRWDEEIQKAMGDFDKVSRAMAAFGI